MSDIVETVARAMHVSVAFNPDDWNPKSPKNETERGYYEAEFKAAAAAIRATIGDLDENISDGMVLAGKEELALSRANGDHPDAQIANTFRAMLFARLKELEA